MMNIDHGILLPPRCCYALSQLCIFCPHWILNGIVGAASVANKWSASELPPFLLLAGSKLPPIETSWIPPGWIKTSWIPPGWIETSWIPPNWIETSWIPPGWIKTSWIPPGWIETSWIPPGARMILSITMVNSTASPCWPAGRWKDQELHTGKIWNLPSTQMLLNIVPLLWQVINLQFPAGGNGKGVVWSELSRSTDFSGGQLSGRPGANKWSPIYLPFLLAAAGTQCPVKSAPTFAHNCENSFNTVPLLFHCSPLFSLAIQHYLQIFQTNLRHFHFDTIFKTENTVQLTLCMYHEFVTDLNSNLQISYLYEPSISKSVNMLMQ